MGYHHYFNQILNDHHLGSYELKVEQCPVDASKLIKAEGLYIEGPKVSGAIFTYNIGEVYCEFQLFSTKSDKIETQHIEFKSNDELDEFVNHFFDMLYNEMYTDKPKVLRPPNRLRRHQMDRIQIQM